MEAYRTLDASLRRLTVTCHYSKPLRSNLYARPIQRIRYIAHAQKRGLACCRPWHQPAAATAPAQDEPPQNTTPNAANPDLPDSTSSSNSQSSTDANQKPSTSSSFDFDRVNKEINQSVGSAYGKTAKQRGRGVRSSVNELVDGLTKKYSDDPGRNPSTARPGSRVPVEEMMTEDEIIDETKQKVPLKERDPGIRKTLGLIPDRTLPPTVAPNIRLGPTLGRTIEVNDLKKMDLGRALRMLEIRCAQNSVRRDFNKQRFHERPGLKRKRLKSERWRARFKTNFKQVIRRVEEMRRKGW